MRLKKLHIKNFRCCKDVELRIGSMHALVGANNAGKSTILHALDFMFNPSTSKISEESFWHRDTALEIRIEGLFDELTDSEKEGMKSCLRPDGTFLFARTATMGTESEEGDEDDGKLAIQPHYCKPQPTYEWLVETSINARKIADWLKTNDRLVVNGKSFTEGWSAKQTVDAWKERAAWFCATALTEADFEDVWIRNPKGFPNVLKANLPHFELIPAVREAADESKALKTNPFGRLISEIVRNLESGLREDIGKQLKETVRRLNREGGDDRLNHITEVEESMKTFLNEVMPADLEIEFQAPTVETLLTTPRIFINDGFRGPIEGKGHGLQRAVIFSILRSYANLVTTRSAKKKRTLILAIEEPELYMHPTAQRTIRRVLRAISDGDDQVLFTTHSPLLVDVTYFDEIIRVEICETAAGEKHCASAHQLTMEAMIEDLETRWPTQKGKVSRDSMRERYSHAYTAGRNEGFFARRVLLVEGLTESYALPIYARSMGHELDALGLAVIDCGGKDQIDRLYRIFNELKIPCFVLFDFDLSNEDAVATRASKAILDFLGEVDFEPTKTTINDHYACFKEKWEVDLVGEIPDHATHRANATKALGSASKPLEARFIASQLARMTPPYVPASVRDIISKAIAVKHRGSCLKSAKVESNGNIAQT